MSKSKGKIIETAFKLFLDKGYSNTSMADLVKASGLSKGGVYHHFSNKENLYQEVIDVYFVSIYQQIDWDSLQELNLEETEEMIKQFNHSFVPDILNLTPKGLSRYFLFFFEAYEAYESFKIEVQQFYTQLKLVLVTKLTQNGSSNPGMEATNLIAKYEGLLFWLAVFPKENIEDIT